MAEASLAGPSVAIIGGGIAGLVCAARLDQLGIHNVTVFDTGKNAPGGRCSSREVNIGNQVHIFDHSAQYFTVSKPAFAKIASFLHARGALKIWQGNIGHLHPGGQFERYGESYQAFVGTDGMRSVALCLASIVNVRRPVWIGNVAWDTSMKKWRVDKFGYFDYLVIAHNGKCADRLLASAGVPQIHSLLRVRFAEKLYPRDQRMQLCSIWVLLVAFPDPLDLVYEGAHVLDDPDICWISNNTKKIGRRPTAASAKPKTAPSASKCNHGKKHVITGDIECWTVFSTRMFGTIHKVPQENIPPKKMSEVTAKMLEAFARVTCVDKQKLKPCYTKVQLWGAAVPMNTLDNADECVFDGTHQIGVCGDWLVSPCIQGAALSGLAAAEKIKLHRSGGKAHTKLDAKFEAVEGNTPIGDFPTDPHMTFKPQQAE